MIQKQKKIKVQTTSQKVTSFGGLIPFVKAIENSSFFLELSKLLPESRHGFGASGTIRSLLYLILSGGNAVTDIDLLDNDDGFKEAVGIKKFPKQNTISVNMNKYSALQEKLSEYLFEVAISYYIQNNISEVTLDIDSTLIKNKKFEAKYCYESFKAYNPMFVVDEKNSLALIGLMRNGNASPQSDILSLIKKTFQRLGKYDISVSYRIDSAGYQQKIIDFLEYNDIPFTITGDMCNSKKKYFNTIPDENWKKLNDKKKEITIAYDQVTSNGKITPIKIIVFRSEKEQYDLIEGRYNYHYIVTNVEDSAENIIKFHRKRGNAENVFKDLKQEYLLSKMPFDSIEANGFFLQIIIAAYNLFRIFKNILFAKKWRRHTIRVIRHRVLRCSAIIRKQARTLKMIICNSYPFEKELKTMTEMCNYTKILC